MRTKLLLDRVKPPSKASLVFVLMLITGFCLIHNRPYVSHMHASTSPGVIGSDKLQLKDIDLKDKRVLIHADFNVMFQIGDPTKVIAPAQLQVQRALPTIQYCIAKDVKSVILVSHLDCQITGPFRSCQHDQMSLQPLAAMLAALLGCEVIFIPKCIGQDVVTCCDRLGFGRVILLEKLPLQGEEGRYQFGVTRTAFYEKFTELADVFIDDVFATADVHKGSILGTGFSTRTFGFQMMKELNMLSKVFPPPPA